ncbi:lipopolysaccharide biosynthesis protein [Pseudoalteromonas prydzensis]|uniref:lipopolysaccharide biosynthesis protein n=1 Tax=Pseudoalteromonas prydzensis TaxID=182141 RepID=UPI003FCF06FA
MSLKKQAVSGVKWTFLQQLSVQIINFGVQIILARLLVPEMFGLIAMIIIFINIGQRLMDGGMTTSLIRTKEPTQVDYSTVFITNVVMSVIIYAFIYMLAPSIATFYEQAVLTEIIRVFSLTFVIQSLIAVHIAKLTKEMNFKLQLKIQLPASIVAGIVGISLANLGFGVWSLVALNITQALIYTLLGWLFINWKPTLTYDIERFKWHFNFGYKLTLSGLIDVIYNDAYRIIIGKYFSPATVGYFHQAETMRLFPVQQISTVMGKVTYPLFANINNDVALKNAYRKSMQLVMFITVPLMLMLVLVAEEGFLFVFGEQWLPAVPFFQILAFASIIRPISAYNLNILKVKGRSDLFLKLELYKKIVGVAAMIIGFQFGVVGLVISLTLVSYFWMVFNMNACGRFIDYKLGKQLKDLVPLYFIGIITLGFCWVIKLVVFTGEHNAIVALFSMMAIYLSTYLLICYMLQRNILIQIKQLLIRRG